MRVRLPYTIRLQMEGEFLSAIGSSIRCDRDHDLMGRKTQPRGVVATELMRTRYHAAGTAAPTTVAPTPMPSIDSAVPQSGAVAGASEMWWNTDRSRTHSLDEPIKQVDQERPGDNAVGHKAHQVRTKSQRQHPGPEHENAGYGRVESGASSMGRTACVWCMALRPR